MLELVEMTKEEYEIYLVQTISHYAQELVDTGLWAKDEALAKADFETKRQLSNSTNIHWLMIKHAELDKTIGFLWFTSEEQYGGKFAYVSDFEIKTEFRRKGFAKMAFLELEKYLSGLGIFDIRLHVFNHNSAAQALYKEVGFCVSGVHMQKEIDPGDI